ncbi:DUF2207 domain-containing protein [Demequina aurantiaca]|uniref:DUF2207 domain-containing protein n=1 Tax=Demequina aurantiaca TaxID=676200 RepID=UPI0013649BBD|nr:DUF2207 domain-containing protein [Demequina aurantiaca]
MRILGSLVLAAVAVLVPTAAHGAATTEPDDFPGRQVTRWDATYDLTAEGPIHVTTDIDFDFGDDPGHGVIWTFPTRVHYDDDYDRSYFITDVAVTSPSGAPDTLSVNYSDNWMEFRVGSQYVDDVSGTQTYVLTYTVDHVMNTSDLGDEFYLNVVGDSWATPISGMTVTVNSPIDATRAQCFTGEAGGDTACDAVTENGATTVFRQGHIDAYTPFTVDTLYPQGSFDTTPSLHEREDFSDLVAITPLTVGGSLVILAGGLLLLIPSLRRKATDEQFADLTPGLRPGLGDDAGVTRRDKKTPVAVEFQPPPGLHPGQLGTLIDEKADPRDVTATIVDLAVRGFLRIDPVVDATRPEAEPSDYTLVKLLPTDGRMVAYERSLFEAIFEGRESVTLSALKTTFAADMGMVQSQMYANVTDLGWFRGNPATARMAWGMKGTFMLLFGLGALIFLFATTTYALIAVPFVIFGVMMLATIKAAPARTAEGTRVLAQTQGFELYLETADAEQLRFEEGKDIFSRYLPYAIAFGIADKWSKKFEALAAQGYSMPEPAWYGGYAIGGFWLASQGFGHQMDSFASQVDSAISAPTPSTSGSSGFSGGGFSGGGSFGGGGGGW